MSPQRCSLLALLALLAWSLPARADDESTEEEAPASDEPADGDTDGEPAPESTAPSAAPSTAPADGSSPGATAAEGVTSPAPSDAPAWVPASATLSPEVPAPPLQRVVDEDLEADESDTDADPDPYEATRERAGHDLLAFRAKRGVPKYFTLFVGASGVSVFDEGLLRWQDKASIPQFSWAFDVFLHERIAVGIAGTLGGWGRSVIDGNASAVDLQLRTGSLEAAAKAVFTPPYWPVRPYVRAGGGARIAAVGLTGDARDDRLARRWHEGAAAYGLVGLGVELTTPRIWEGVNVPWGIGLRVEGGAEIGGGGSTVLAPSVDLGSAGRLDLGPVYADVGLLLLF